MAQPMTTKARRVANRIPRVRRAYAEARGYSDEPQADDIDLVSDLLLFVELRRGREAAEQVLRCAGDHYQTERTGLHG